jgi:membrane-associated protease RseP (regulator of RpoE activity)
MSGVGWLIFLLALVISLTLHETGHFLAAKKCGMQVTRYFIGVGPTLWSTWKGETEYGVKALPFGAFVKVTGMTSLDEVDPADEPRSFRSQPAWQRATFLAAGPLVHFVLAFALLSGLAMGIGRENDNTTQLGKIGTCLPASERALENGACTSGAPKSPAQLAGLRAGDKVVALNGTPARTWTQLGAAIRRAPSGTAAAITVRRDGRQLTLHARLAAISGHPGSYLGISAAAVFQAAGPVRAAEYAGSMFGQIFASSAKAAAAVPDAVPRLFAKDRASIPGGSVTSIVGASRATGEVVSARDKWQLKVASVLLIIASLNIFIGAFNLLPLLPLDGGRLAVLCFERARTRLARLRGRPDPGLADMRKLVPVTLCVVAVFACFSLLLIAADIVNPVA